MKSPSMTPYASIRQGDLNKLPVAVALTSSPSSQPISAVSSTGDMRRSSSDVTIAGSIDSFDSNVTIS